MLSIGKTVYLWRSERGLTQEQLARATGIPRPNLSNLERGKQELSLKTLRLLASVLKVTPGTLVDGISPLAVKGPLEFSRQELDRIADASFGDKKLGGRQAEVVDLLKILASNQISKKSHSGKRRVNAAWLQFKSALPREIVHALIQRIQDRERLRQNPNEIAGSR